MLTEKHVQAGNLPILSACFGFIMKIEQSVDLVCILCCSERL